MLQACRKVQISEGLGIQPPAVLNTCDKNVLCFFHFLFFVCYEL